MHTIRNVLALVLLVLAASVTAAPRDIAIPTALRDWTGWVLHGHEHELYPRVSGSATACGWPGELRLDVDAGGARSEEHTSELQSLMRISYAVFCLKKKTEKKQSTGKL